MGHESNEIAPERIGPYVVLAPIASGPRSRVVLARALDDPDAAPVAIKQPVSAAEADLLSNIDHRHIVRALSTIDEPGTPPAIVMEYGDGGSLADRLGAGQLLAANEVATTLAPIADALATLHDAGIVHQDVKPENIVFVGSRAVLIDFGSATTADTAGAADADVVLASVDYLDPDVADGAAPNPRSDQYAFAATCYAALTGCPPHRSRTALATLRSADLADHVRLDPDLHGPMAHVIERALARRPSDRFDDLRSLAAALCAPAACTPLDRIGAPVPRNHDPDHDETSLRPDRAVTSAIGSVATARQTTRIFRTRRVELDGARAVRGPRISRRVAAIGAAVVITGGLVGWATTRSPRQVPVAASQPRAQRPSCDPRTEAQCVKDWERSSAGMTVHFVNENQTVRYEVGRVSDGLRVANYFCGGSETLALYRPETGVVYYWTAWPEDGSDDRSAVVTFADRTGIVGARPSTGDIDSDGCADLALDGADGRTWFSPHGQPRRLARVDALPPGDGA